MKYNIAVLKDAERLALEHLSTPAFEVESVSSGSKEMQRNENYVNPKSITSPAFLIQEQAYLAATGQYIFDFSINGPVNSSVLNNRKLPQNNIAAIYGLQLLQGQGDSAVSRGYFSTGFSVNDRAIYNSNLQMKVETDTVIDNFDCQQFNEIQETPGMIDGTSSVVPINPIRILTGKLGTFQIIVTPYNTLSALTLTTSMYLSMRLMCVMGQASA